MGAGEFERILGEKLRLDGPPPSGLPRPAPLFWPIGGSFQTPPFLAWQTEATGPGAAAAFRSHARHAAPGPARRPDGPPVAPRTAQVARRLSTAQRSALDTLRSMGAETLDAGFTALELKRAFRALALRYHPDRHPDGGAQQQRALARAFGRVNAAYRTLLACTT